MTVTINGTSGITSPGLNSTGSNTLGDNVADTLNVGNGAIVTDSSGNVGIGTSSPAKKLHVYTAVDTPAQFESSGTTSYIRFANSGASNGYVGYNSSSAMEFLTAGSERMRIDSSGNLLVGTTSGNYKFVVNANYNAAKLGSLTAGLSGGEYPSVGSNVRYTSTTGSYTYDGSDFASMIRFNSGKVETLTAASGSSGNAISFTTGPYVAQGGTSWTNSSDERLKTDFEPIENAADKVNTLRSVIGRFKTDPQDKRRAFLIAQDVQAVLPEAVDASDPDNLGVQYTDVIPLLVAAIKELSAKNDALEARIAALETK